MKKVAATRGQSVRRTNFFRLGTTARGWGFSFCWRGALAVANFDVFLLKRLTLSYSAAAGSARAFRFSWIPEITLELVRSVEITGISQRCKKIVEIFRNFLSRRTVRRECCHAPGKMGLCPGVLEFEFPGLRDKIIATPTLMWLFANHLEAHVLIDAAACQEFALRPEHNLLIADVTAKTDAFRD